MRNIFLEKSCTNGGAEISPRPFFKKSKLSVSLDQQSEVSYRLFILYLQVEDYQNILKLWCSPFPFTSYKALKKQKEVWN